MRLASSAQTLAAALARSSPARAWAGVRSPAGAGVASASQSGSSRLGSVRASVRARAAAGLAAMSCAGRSCMVASLEEVGGGERELDVAVRLARGAGPGAEPVVADLPAGGG